MIKRLNIKGFGRLCEKELELHSGLNVITAKNGEGKSTVGVFIKSMLFGFLPKKTKDVERNERLHYTPWDASTTMGGTMELSIDGRNIRIERSFGEVPSKDKINVVDMTTGEEVKKYAKCPGTAIFSMSLPTFERTAFIGQGSYKIDGTDEMRNKLSNIISSASEDVSCKKAVAALNKKRLSYTGKGGIITELEEIINEIEDERAKTSRINKEYGHILRSYNKKGKELSELNKKEEQLLALRQEAYCLKDKRDYEKILSSRRQISEIEGILINLRADMAKGGRLIDTNTAVELNRLYDRSRHCREELSAKISRERFISDSIKSLKEQKLHIGLNEEDINRQEEVLSIESEIDRKKAALQEKNIYKERAEKLKKELENIATPYFNAFTRAEKEGIDLEHTNCKKPFTVSVILLIGAILCLAGGIALQMFNMTLFSRMFYALGIGLFLILFFIQIKYKRYFKSLLLKIGVSCKEEFCRELNRYKTGKEKYNELNKNIAILESQYSEADTLQNELKKLQGKLSDILNLLGSKTAKEFYSKINKFKNLTEQEQVQQQSLISLREEIAIKEKEYKRECDAAKKYADELFYGLSSANEIPERLQKTLQAQKESDNLMTLIKEINRRIETLADGRSEEELKDAAEKAAKSNIKISLDEIEKQIELIGEKQKELGQERAAIGATAEHFFENIRSVAQIDEELSLRKSQLADANLRHSALCDAIKHIGLAAEQMQRNFAPELNRRAGKYLYAITNGRYKNILVDRLYNIRVEEDGCSHPISYYSAGTIDQIYLSLRLALISIMEEEGSPLPLILDDAFSNFDDDRLRCAMDSVCEIAKGRQVMLFTCQQRELKILNEKSEKFWKRIEL